MATRFRYIPTLPDIWIYWNIFWIAFRGWGKIFSRKSKKHRVKHPELRTLQTVHLLELDGWTVLRTKGPTDIIAAKEGVVKLIQVKLGKNRMKPWELSKLENSARAFNGKAEVWYYTKR